MPYAYRECSVCHRQYRPSKRPDDPTCWPCTLVAKREQPPAQNGGAPKPTPQGATLAQRIKRLLGKTPMSVAEIGDALDLRPSERGAVQPALDELAGLGLALGRRPDGRFTLDHDSIPGGKSAITTTDRGDGWTVIGFTADNHLGSKHERLDVLNALYDTFAAEGVEHVYNAGNWIEGEARFNRHDIKVFGLDAQIDYFVQHYPQRPGIITHYVAGDDHEGWYQQRECVNVGQLVEMKAARAGRTDLHYLGYVEADVALTTTSGSSAPLKVMHGGGGSPYAYSYVLQKTVEAFQGGEKPAVLCVGHHHKFDSCYPRNVYAFMPGCTEDQSIFMRKRRIEAHVGGVLAWIKQDQADGHVTRCRVDWMPFYDRGFYERRYE